MIFSQTSLSEVILISLEKHEDERGYFARTMCRTEFEARGLVADFAQDSISYNGLRGTLRGLHYQRPPYAETKLVRCVRGCICDVVVDIRPGSPTHLCWQSFELSELNGDALYIPMGFAHGFQTRADSTMVAYRISQPHAADAACGIRYDDPLVGIAWPEPVTVISERDASWPYVSPRRSKAQLRTSFP
jgi:dTDP-4-dehydrorhamnose 3,5-epimerase